MTVQSRSPDRVQTQPQDRPQQEGSPIKGWDEVDEASWESFPASDPPSKWAGKDEAPPTLNSEAEEDASAAEESQSDRSGNDFQWVDLNHATHRELVAIEGLGPQLAHALIAHRVHHGHFTAWEDLRSIDGMGASQLDALQRACRLAEHPPSADARAHGHRPIQRP